MNILLIGGGGREHALAWKISQSPNCDQLHITPGNAGTSQCGTNHNISVTDFDAIGELILENNIEMVVVGPEIPLVEGIVDHFTTDEFQNIKFVGPSENGAILEGSKAYAKKFMLRHGIPTAAFGQFNAMELKAAEAFIDQQTAPIVLKCDGLAAGKGVLISSTKKEAKNSIREIFAGKFGEAGELVVIEDFLEGIEFSVFVLSDGEHYQVLPVAKDYKKIGEGDKGLNTGGMGAISPPPFVNDELMKKVIDEIVEPTMHGLRTESVEYKGFIFFGLINVDGCPKVIEYNCRLGDPETEVIIPRIENDIVELFDSLFDGSLKNKTIEITNQTAATVMLVSGGYPEKYEKGKVITNIPEPTKESIVFHAGSKMKGDQIVTNGGRVLAITSLAANHKTAVNRSLKIAEQIDFDKKYFRKDIGFDL